MQMMRYYTFRECWKEIEHAKNGESNFENVLNKKSLLSSLERIIIMYFGSTATTLDRIQMLGIVLFFVDKIITFVSTGMDLKAISFPLLGYLIL